MICVKLSFSVVLGDHTDLLESTSLAMSSNFLLLAKGDCLVKCISVTSNLLLRVHGDCAVMLSNDVVSAVAVRLEFVRADVRNRNSVRRIIGDFANMHKSIVVAACAVVEV